MFKIDFLLLISDDTDELVAHLQVMKTQRFEEVQVRESEEFKRIDEMN
jgi:hypothetical protein